MKHTLLLLLLCTIHVTQLVAQTISGTVVDEQKNPLPYVSVMLRNAENSVLVGGVATKTDGSFSIPVKNGVDYVLSLSYTGYNNIDKTCRAGNVGTIVMKEKATMLEEVSVVASRTRHNADGYTVNLRSATITKGKQSSDMLAFLPGVSVENGAYKINGLPVSQIYVDGVKLTSLDELKNLPADMVEKVKVNYLAGINQNASEMGGTIEISLRQPPKGGFYGALTADATLFPSYGFSDENIGGIIYYRYKDLSVYNNLSLNFNQPQETSRQTVWNQSNNLRTELDEETKHCGQTFRNRLSLTQQLNNRSSIGGSYYIATNRLRTTSKTMQLGGEDLQSEITAKRGYTDQEATLKYTTALNQRGKSLEATADYFSRRSDNNTDYTFSGNLPTLSKDKTDLNMYKLAADITAPHSQTLVWKYGASLQYITSDYTPTESGANASGRFPTSVIASQTSGFTPLAYVSAMGMFWKFRYSAGINWQLNHIEYKADGDHNKSVSTQWGVNPTVQMMMPLDNKGRYALMLNYKRTLDDIPYAAISSTVRWTDSYNYTGGNPNLKSPSTNMVMAGLSMFNNLLRITTIYAHAKDNIYWETLQSPAASDVFYTTPINLPGTHVFGFGPEINWRALQQWTIKLSGRLEVHPEDITLGGVYYGKTNLRQYYTMYNSFNFNHGWGGMLNLMCEPTYTTYDRTYHTVYNVGGQIYKTMCRGNLQLSLTFDAFGDRRKFDRSANGSKITYDYTTPVQNIGLALVWKFSGGKSVNVRTVENGVQSFKEVNDVR